jgi:hypothetical protein
MKYAYIWKMIKNNTIKQWQNNRIFKMLQHFLILIVGRRVWYGELKESSVDLHICKHVIQCMVKKHFRFSTIVLNEHNVNGRLQSTIYTTSLPVPQSVTFIQKTLSLHVY